jgi:hypothetical protein
VASMEDGEAAENIYRGYDRESQVGEARGKSKVEVGRVLEEGGGRGEVEGVRLSAMRSDQV